MIKPEVYATSDMLLSLIDGRWSFRIWMFLIFQIAVKFNIIYAKIIFCPQRRQFLLERKNISRERPFSLLEWVRGAIPKELQLLGFVQEHEQGIRTRRRRLPALIRVGATWKYGKWQGAFESSVEEAKLTTAEVGLDSPELVRAGAVVSRKEHAIKAV